MTVRIRKSKATEGDRQYVKWLEDQSMTIGKTIRLEIASRLRELTAMGKRDA